MSWRAVPRQPVPGRLSWITGRPPTILRRPRNGPAMPTRRRRPGLPAVPAMLMLARARQCDKERKPSVEYQSIEVRKLTPTIGAEISGVDLRKPLGNQQFQEVHRRADGAPGDLLPRPGADAGAAQVFGRCFGELHIHPNSPGHEGHPEILPIHADANSKRIAGEVGTPTCPAIRSRRWARSSIPEDDPACRRRHVFASMYAAYDALSAPMKRFLDGCTAIHASLKSANHQYREKTADMRFPESEHPVVRDPSGNRPARRSTSIAVSPPAYPSLRTLKATPCWRCCSVTLSSPGFIAGSNGSRTRSPFGTTGRRCIRPCGTTIRHGVTDIGSPCAAISRSYAREADERHSRRC